MNSTTIKIDGSKLRELLEKSTGKTIYQIAKESGYSKNVISNAIRTGYASSAVQNIAKLYGFNPEAYKAVEPIKETEPERSQISIYDIGAEDLKAVVKEALAETLQSFNYIRVTGISYDPENKRFKLFVNEEDLLT